MKWLTVIVAAFILVFGAVASRAANVERISTATGVPLTTLQAERASTGLGWGSLEKAHLLALAVYPFGEISPRRNLWTHGSDSAGRLLDSLQHR